MITHLDLFSGIGGFSLAAKEAGIKTIGFSEIEPFCCRILQKNFENIPNFGDIRNINNHSYVDIITGGFPCQPFSIAGKKKGREDERYMWPEMLRVINEVKPNWVIAENVTGLVEMEIDNIIDDLEIEGYETQSFIIPACAENAPHRRDRLWIIANRNRHRCNDRRSDRQERCFQNDWQRNIAQIQSKWSQLKPFPWETYTAKDWFEANTRASRIYDGVPERLDKNRLKALGNSIVPQIAFVLLRLIKEIGLYEQ